MKKVKFIVFFVFVVIFFPIPSRADFDPNNIISDYEVLNYNSMNLDEIKELLKSKNSYLYNYSAVNPDGKSMTAAEIIYDRAITNKISPRFLIVLLQKEMGLIEDQAPKQTQLDWATGYGCFDDSPCNTRWQGFWKQVNSASLQFRDYIDNPQLYTYRAGETYTFSNLYSTTINGNTIVTPRNNATAALYNYTPHVYNGNYNFYKIWQRYFTRDYLDGSLLRAEGESGVWLIQNGKKRPFLTKGALVTRFDERLIITVEKAELDKYSKGTPIKFSQYSLIRSPRGTVFLLVDDKKRGFASSEAFRLLGFNPEEVDDVSWEDINAYEDGEPVTASSTYPTGALLQDKTTGGVYWVMNNKKSPLWDSAFLKTKFKDKKINPVAKEELEKYETIAPVLFGDGTLLKSKISPTVFIIANGKKNPIVSGDVFEKLGYKWENILSVSDKLLYLYPEGDIIASVTQ